jgi:hypothetical protein
VEPLDRDSVSFALESLRGRHKESPTPKRADASSMSF